MNKKKEWQRFTELREGTGIKKLTPTEVYLYKHGLHIFMGFMLLLVLIIHVMMTRKRKKQQAFAHLNRE